MYNAEANEGLLLERTVSAVCGDHVLYWTHLLNLQSYGRLVKSSLEMADGPSVHRVWLAWVR